MNRGNFQYILEKLYTKITKKQQHTVKSLAYLQRSVPTTLWDQLYIYIIIYSNIHIFLSYIPQDTTKLSTLVILTFLPSFNRKYNKINKI